MLSPNIIDEINQIYCDLMALENNEYGRIITNTTCDTVDIGRNRNIEISVVELEEKWADEYLRRLKLQLIGIRKFKKILSIVFTSIFLLCAVSTFLILYFNWNFDYGLLLSIITFGIFAGIASLPFNIQIIIRLSHRPRAKKMYKAEESVVLDYVTRVKRIYELCNKHNIPYKMRTVKWIKRLNSQIVALQKTDIPLSKLVDNVCDMMPKRKECATIMESVNEYIKNTPTDEFAMSIGFDGIVSNYRNYRDNPWTTDTARRKNKQRRKEMMWKHLERWASCASSGSSYEFKSIYDTVPSVSDSGTSEYEFLFGDGGGATIKYGNVYKDYAGNYCDKDSYFVDAKGFIRSKNSGFFDYGGDYRMPGEPYRDPSGAMVYPQKR